MSCVVVIPARGGSKGILRKNLCTVGGVSLVERAVKTACAVHGIYVCVSTDDDDAASAARRHEPATVRWRPPELCTDEASTESALLHALDHYPECEHVILMQCTSPFTQPQDIRHVHEKLLAGAECVVTVTPSYAVPWKLDDNGRDLVQVPGIDGINPRKRRQDREPIYIETGALYGMRVDLLRATGSRFCGKPEAVMMPKYRSLEIDDGWDLAMAQRMAAWPGDSNA